MPPRPLRIPRPQIPMPLPPQEREPRRQLGLAARTKRDIATIKKRHANAHGEFWEVGKALGKLNRPAVWRAFGSDSFSSFVSEHVIPYSTAQRYIVVASSYTKAMAKKLGITKAAYLLRYVEATGGRRSAQQLALRDAKIGSPKTPISMHSAQSIKRMLKGAELAGARADKRSPSRRERSVAKTMERQFTELFGVDPAVRVDTKRRVIRFEVSFDDLELS